MRRRSKAKLLAPLTNPACCMYAIPPSRRLRLCLLACTVLLVGPLHAADRASQRSQFRAALAAAARPPEGAWMKLAAGLDAERYPLYPYIELAALRPRLAKLAPAEVERFLKRWADTLPAADLRQAWLRELARRGDWKTFLADWAPNEDRDLQCNAVLARLSGGAKLDYAKDIETLWQGERALPGSCAAVLRAARVQGIVADAVVWEHLEQAADAGRADVAEDAAALLTGNERIAADRIVAALRDPSATLAKAKTRADEPRARDALAYALARLARRNSDAAETQWADLEARFKWDDAQKNRVLNAIALYRATSYSPDALARLKALPATADDDATREWRVRGALAGADWAGTLAALDRLSDTQKADARWRYLRARVLGKLGRDAEAATLMADVAREANFHGFLAADWSSQPYTICPNTLAGDDAAESALARQPDLERAYEFRELGMLSEARREWKFAMGKLDANQRRLAADGAYRKGWYDRAVFAFSADPDTQRLYEQRFPLGMEALVRREAAGAGIDPSWAYGILRAESAWMTDAHSHVALGGERDPVEAGGVLGPADVDRGRRRGDVGKVDDGDGGVVVRRQVGVRPCRVCAREDGAGQAGKEQETHGEPVRSRSNDPGLHRISPRVRDTEAERGLADECASRERQSRLQPMRKVECAQAGQGLDTATRERDRLEALAHVAGQGQALDLGDAAQALDFR